MRHKALKYFHCDCVTVSRGDIQNINLLCTNYVIKKLYWSVSFSLSKKMKLKCNLSLWFTLCFMNKLVPLLVSAIWRMSFNHHAKEVRANSLPLRLIF